MQPILLSLQNITLRLDTCGFKVKERTGIEIKRYEVQKIDFLKDVAEITLYFNANGNTGKPALAEISNKAEG